MQPNKRLRKTVLAGAFVLSAGNAFNASADLFPVTAGAIPDVTAGLVAGYTELSFGEGIIGSKVGETCTLSGFASVPEDDLQFDIGANGTDNADGTYGDLTGEACVDSTGEGSLVLIEIEGAAGSTVAVSVPDVTGTGYTYSATANSCVIDFDGGTTDTLDSCQTFSSETVINVGVSGTQSDGVNTNADELPNAAKGYAAMVGKTRMVLAGAITVDSEIAAGTTINDNIIVQVTYEQEAENEIRK